MKNIKKILMTLTPIGCFLSLGVIVSCAKIQIDTQDTHIKNFAQLKAIIETDARQGKYDSKVIEIDEDIVCTEPIYVMNDITITSSSNHSISRATNFLDDMFVVGEDENGNNPILTGEKAKLNIKTNSSDAVLTIDGNKDAITDETYGSAIFISNHSEVNIYDNVVVQNFRKDKNVRALTKRISKPATAGGAAAIITSGTFNIYGGTITNCVCPAADEEAEKAYMGGAIYCEAGLNMYGGTISNCSAARGGGLYNYSYCNLIAGTISNCSSTKYGGAIYLPNSQYSNLVLGSDQESTAKMIFKENNSDASGGAIFGQHQSVIYSMGNCIFESNTATNNGGAINSSGTVLLDNTELNSNKATGSSSKGGAIYAYANSETLTIRETQLNNCTFNSNTSVLSGGAITFDSAEDSYPGAIGLINNSIFKSNSSGKGGAISAQKQSNVTIKGSTFNSNSATGNGGALYNTNANIYLLKSDVTNLLNENTAGGKGGAIAVHSNGLTTIEQAAIDKNTSTSNGGGLYLYGGSCNITAETKDDVVFTNNSGAGGGAIYISINSDEQFEAKLNATYINASSNVASDNGGGVYVYTSAQLNVNNMILKQNTANGSTGGGGLYLSGASNTIIDHLEATSNAAKSGGFAYITSSGTSLIIKEGIAAWNTSSATAPSGSTLWCNAKSSIVKIKGKISKEYFNFDGDISGVDGFEVQDYEE